MGASPPTSSPSNTELLLRISDLFLQFAPNGDVIVQSSSRSGSVQLPPPAAALLAHCDGKRTVDQVAGAVLLPGHDATASIAENKKHLDRLERQGFVFRRSPEAGPDATWGYHRPEVHRAMLQDRPRTELFRDGLYEVVKPGSVVMDMGAGTGILSMFAAKAGAAAVHAIESTEIANWGRQIAAANDLDQVTFHQIEADHLDLDTKADVIVSEWLGYFVYSDGMYPAVAKLRDRYLKPDGAMVPSHVDILLAPMAEDPATANVPAYWTTDPYGFNYAPLLKEELRGPIAENRVVSPDVLIAEPHTIKKIDCGRDRAEDIMFSHTGVFELTRDTTLTSFCGWFTCQLSPSVLLDTGPHAPETHWQQRIFPVEPFPVRNGDTLEYTFIAHPSPTEYWRTELVLEFTLHGPSGPQRRRYTYEDY